MNELMPIKNHPFPTVEEEMSLSIFDSMDPNKVILFLIPIAFILLMKHKDLNLFPMPKYSSSNHRTNTIKPTTSPIMSLDGDTLDKAKRVIDGIKKVQNIQHLRQTRTSSGGKMNFEVLKEVLDIAGSVMGDSNKSQIQNVANLLSVADKVKDVKKILDVKKAFKASDGDPGSKINNIIDVLGPMIPAEYAKNIETLKKMTQMMKYMSMFEGSGEETDYGSVPES